MDFNTLAVECAPWVAPQTLAAIVRTESEFKPLTIGVNGGHRLVRQPATLEEAIVTAKWLINSGYNIDLGLGQVNSSNLVKTGLTIESAFDPCKNLAASAAILQSNYVAANPVKKGEQRALHEALSAYNTGSYTRGFTNGYVQKVVGNASSTVAPIPLARKVSSVAIKKNVAMFNRTPLEKTPEVASVYVDVSKSMKSDDQVNAVQDEQMVMIYR